MMLGNRVLPDSVQSQRRRLRSRLRDIREPIRRRRQNLVPGPDLIGSAESRLMDLRSRAMQRDGFVDMMKNARSDSSGSGSSGGGSSGSETSNERNRGSSSGNEVKV